MPLHVGDTNAEGLVQCVDINRVENDVYRVTVREMIGGGYSAWVGGREAVMPRMRRLARRLAPEGAKVSTVLRSEFYAGNSQHATFVVEWRSTK